MIKVVASFAFAKEADLGWDPTFRRRTHGGQYVFDIDVHAPAEGTVETFTADKIIYNFGADAMHGRGTRVFRAKASDGKTVVVKDVWRDQNGVCEGDLFNTIMDSMRLDPLDFVTAQKHFLPVLCHGDVMIGGQPDRTLDWTMHAASPCPKHGTTRKRKREASTGDLRHLSHFRAKARLLISRSEFLICLRPLL